MESDHSNISVLSGPPIVHTLVTNASVEWLDTDRVDVFRIVCFVWLTLSCVLATIVFLATPKIRHKRQSIIAFNLVLSVFIHEMLFSSTLIYHDLKGYVFHWTIGLHFCRLSILAQTFSMAFLSYTILVFTADALLHVAVLARHSSVNVATRGLSVAAVLSPWILASIATAISIFPFSPKIGKIWYHQPVHGKIVRSCMVDFRSPDMRILTSVTSSTLICALPATTAVILACCLMGATYRHLSTYQTMALAGSVAVDRGRRVQQVAVSTLCMDLLHLFMTGPYYFAKYTGNLRNSHSLHVGVQVFLAIVPVLWFCLQPELLPLLVSAGRRCLKSRPADDIREYHPEKQDTLELT